jgi:hypothetical protein
LFDYHAPTVAIAILRYPLSTSIDALAKFVITVAKVPCDEATDTLVLYKRDHDSTGPGRTRLRPDWYPTIQYDFENVVKDGKRYLFYRHLRGVSPAEYEAGTIQTVTFVEQDRSLIKTEDVCLPKSVTVGGLEPKLEQINFFAGDQREKQGIVVGDWACSLIGPSASLWYAKKIVYVVVERGADPNEKLVLISEATIGSTDYLVPAGIPGFIKVGADATLGSAKPGIGQLFGLAEEKLKKVKFFSVGTWARFAVADALKDTFSFADLADGESLYIVIDLKRPASRYRAVEESIHIAN